MKYFKKRNTLENSTGKATLKLDTLEAHSYNWWQFTQLMPDGTVLFNNYSYSNSTSKHQSNVWWFLHKNGIPMKTVYWCAGLQNPSKEIDNKKYEIEQLQKLINTKGTRKAKNAERQLEIQSLLKEIDFINDYVDLRSKGVLDKLTFKGTLDLTGYSNKPKHIINGPNMIRELNKI